MRKKTLYAFIISFILLTTVIVLNRLTYRSMTDYYSEVERAQEVITTFESLSNDFKSAQIYTPTFNSDSVKNFYKLYKKDAENVRVELEELKQRLSKNEDQRQLVSDLKYMINIHLDTLMLHNVAELVRSGQSWR